jgi:DNA-binding cell septation regulator SpoVG
MNIIDVKQVNKGSIKLTFSLGFPAIGLMALDCKLMSGKNGNWISFPSREYEDADGKKRYYSYVVIDDARKEAFQAKCMELLAPYLVTTTPAVEPPAAW